jgi:hypothetical protein
MENLWRKKSNLPEVFAFFCNADMFRTVVKFNSKIKLDKFLFLLLIVRVFGYLVHDPSNVVEGEAVASVGII